MPQDWEHLFQPGGPAAIGPGYQVTDRDLSKTGNVVAFGPVAQEYSELEALLIVVAFSKFMKTPDGQKHVKDIIVKYLENVGNVIKSMQQASSGNVLTALINQYSCTNIFARFGFITSFDQLQTKVWLDHVYGEMLKKDYAMAAVQGITTLVDASSMTEKVGVEEIISKTAGLATLAKVFAAAP